LREPPTHQLLSSSLPAEPTTLGRRSGVGAAGQKFAHVGKRPEERHARGDRLPTPKSVPKSESESAASSRAFKDVPEVQTPQVEATLAPTASENLPATQLVQASEDQSPAKT